MARRMFSPKIVASDAFLDMPTSSRELYFQLGMYADDDGFVNPKRIIRMLGASDDDLKVLIAKRFVLPFENGVVVIKHWLINNMIRKDFYKETVYLDEKKRLQVKDNGAYTDNVDKMLTEPTHRIGKVRIGKVRLESQESSISYLSKIPQSDIEEWTIRFIATETEIKNKAESLKLYCEAKNKKYSNYKSFLLNALKRDFKERTNEVSKYSSVKTNTA